MAYADKTDVPVAKSRADIEALLARHRCTSFACGVDYEQATARVEFKAGNDGRIIRFGLALPKRTDKAFTRDRHGRPLATASVEKRVAQAERQRWRALLLVIRAKIEAVESGITTFEQEFLAHIVLPNQQTVADYVLPDVRAMYETGRMPPDRMLTDGRGDDNT